MPSIRSIRWSAPAAPKSGVRSLALPRLHTTLVASGACGSTPSCSSSATPARRRRAGRAGASVSSGMPTTASSRWLSLDGSVAYSQARFTDGAPEGDRIPGAIEGVDQRRRHASHPVSRWSGSLRWRYFGPRPLIEDNSVRSQASNVVSAEAGYQLNRSFRVKADLLNLFDSKSSDIDYFYTSRLPGEPVGGLDGIHFHPVEPFTSARARWSPASEQAVRRAATARQNSPVLEARGFRLDRRTSAPAPVCRGVRLGAAGGRCRATAIARVVLARAVGRVRGASACSGTAGAGRVRRQRRVTCCRPSRSSKGSATAAATTASSSRLPRTPRRARGRSASFGSEAQQREWLPGLADGRSSARPASPNLTPARARSTLATTAVRRRRRLDPARDRRHSSPTRRSPTSSSSTPAPARDSAASRAFSSPRDTPGLTVGPPIEKMGLRTSPDGAGLPGRLPRARPPPGRWRSAPAR